LGKISKKLYWTLSSAAFLLALFLALVFILPRIVDSTWLKTTVQAEVAKRIQGDFNFSRADVTILPLPAVTLKQVSLTIPETARIQLETLTLHPRLLPLLIGKIDLDAIVIDKPDFSLPLPQKSATGQEAGETMGFPAFMETAAEKISPVLATISGLNFNLEQGTLRLFSGKAQVLLAANINGEFRVNDKGLSASISSFTVHQENENITAEIDNFRGSIELSEQGSVIAVEDLTLSSPQVQLSGKLTFDQTAHHAGLEITSQDTDITGVGEVLPVFLDTLYGDLPSVREIFAIIRGGTLSQAIFQVEGEKLTDLAVFESMHIKAQVNDAKVVLSDLGLDLQGVTGDATIDNGVLEGRNLQARLGNSTGSNGFLKLGLVKKETTPFHLDLDLNADLADVPPLLGKMVPEKHVLEYLSLIESIEGTTQVGLTLGESLESLTVRVEANKISGQAKYKPIPYPVSINGGRILYDGLITHSFNLQGKVGRSTFSNYSSSMNFEGEPTIEVESGTFNLVLDEIFSWLAKDKRLEDDLHYIKSLTGSADVNVKSIKGPLLQPVNLQYELQCNLKEVDLTTVDLPGPLKITSGEATISRDKTLFENLQADLLDSSLTFSGVLQNYLYGKTEAEIIVTNGKLGARVNAWVSEELVTPKEYTFRTPLLISRAAAKWTREELLDLQGDFSIEDGPIFSIDLKLSPNEVLLRNLSLNNEDEHAKLGLTLKKRTIGAEFQGSLSQSTINKILEHYDKFPNAWIRGNMQFYYNMDSPAQTVASGKLDGGVILIPWEIAPPLMLESFSLSAADKTLTLHSAEAVFAGNTFAMAGKAFLTEENLSLDLDVSTGTIALHKILPALQNTERSKDKVESRNKGEKFKDLAVRAAINLHAGSLQYNKYTWKPFESHITYENSSLGIEVMKADLCNISTPGKLSFQDGQISLDFTMEAHDKEFSDLLICLEGGQKRMTGVLNLDANIAGHGTKETLAQSLQGELLLRAKDGYIYHDAHAAKLLSLLNVTDMFRDKIPDLQTEGFHYDSLIVKGIMGNGIITITPAKLEAPIMQIVANGTIELPSEKIDLQVLVAPLQTINKIQKMLPVIRQIIPTSLAALPVEVKGDFADIKVRTLSMSAIGTRVFNVMVDALSTPVRVLEGPPAK
jgi:hypothetical protein